MPTLRPYQVKIEDDIERAWAAGKRCVLAIAPTGAGKTVTFSNILQRCGGASAAIAHRRELVSQMSIALARNGVRHRVIAPSSVCREIVGLHMVELGRSFYDPNARCGVVGIDSLVRLDPTDPWLRQVEVYIGDEGHHFLRDNKWGRGVAMFPNARGALFTATGFRADGQGLGAHADGLADALVLGPAMGDVIAQGYLTDYRIVAPPTDIDYSDVPTTESGDLSPAKLRAKVHASTRIVGDVVTTYQRFAAGKLTCAFAVDVEAAQDLASGFRAVGIRAEVISAGTPALLRMDLLRRFRLREISVLVNVDLFGEGFDLPALECVIMVRKTESRPLFDQQFGRVLRLMLPQELSERWDSFTAPERLAHIAASQKPHGLVIDHVGNVVRHLPPDAPRVHTLERQDRKSRSVAADAIPLRQCLNDGCFGVYERVLPECPYCGVKPVPSSRSAPAHVDGDLFEMDAELLDSLRGQVRRILGAPRYPAGVSTGVAQSIKNAHFERQRAQAELREAIDLWCGYQTQLGRELSEQYRRFYFSFGVDVLSALGLGRPDAQALRERITRQLDIDGIVKAEVLSAEHPPEDSAP